MNQGPNVRLMRVAAQLELLAKDVTTALEHVQAELGILDSYPTQTPGASIATGVYHEPRPHDGDCGGCDTCDPVDLTRVERAAFARVHLTSQHEKILDHIDSLTITATSLANILDRTLRHRVTTPIVLCDGRPFAGSDILWTPHSRDPRNGWYDPLCAEAADASGLSPRCRVREARWRRENGLPPRFANAATDAA